MNITPLINYSHMTINNNTTVTSLINFESMLIENNTNLASLIAESSITIAGILIAIIVFTQTYHITISTLRENIIIAPTSDQDILRKRVQLKEKWKETHTFFKKLKILSIIFAFVFLLALIWIISIMISNISLLKSMMAWLTIILFLLGWCGLLYVLIKIKLGDND